MRASTYGLLNGGIALLGLVALIVVAIVVLMKFPSDRELSGARTMTVAGFGLEILTRIISMVYPMALGTVPVATRFAMMTVFSFVLQALSVVAFALVGLGVIRAALARRGSGDRPAAPTAPQWQQGGPAHGAPGPHGHPGQPGGYEQGAYGQGGPRY
ncbi:hypothetical protein GCM10027418_31890 [Mariniluteicoccus endophyticus]